MIQSRFDAGEWLRLAAKYRISSVFLVPTMLQRILDHPDLETTDLSDLKAIYYGAAAAPIELVKRAMAALPHVAFANIFGQTETLGAYTTLTPADHFAPERSAPSAALPGVEIRVVDPATEEEFVPGEVGELWVLSDRTSDRDGCTPATSPGSTPTATSTRVAGSPTRSTAAGRSSGRSRSRMCSATHPAVTDVAAAGVPDSEMGERVGVAIVATSPMTR